MDNPFKQQAKTQTSPAPETPYQKAGQIWDERIGSAREQAKNWRIIALISIVTSAALLMLLIIIMSIKDTKVFVAEVTHGGKIINVVPLQQAYKPTLAQKEYFITNFIKLTRAMSLDPVLAKKNFMSAYNFLTQRSSLQLNKYIKDKNPLEKLGKQTITVNIEDINPISEQSFQVGWTETTVDINGENLGTKNFSGVFTIMIQPPVSQQQILQNPLGVYIIDFNFSARD